MLDKYTDIIYYILYNIKNKNKGVNQMIKNIRYFKSTNGVRATFFFKNRKWSTPILSSVINCQRWINTHMANNTEVYF
jgi:hypothetical protein